MPESCSCGICEPTWARRGAWNLRSEQPGHMRRQAADVGMGAGGLGAQKLQAVLAGGGNGGAADHPDGGQGSRLSLDRGPAQRRGMAPGDSAARTERSRSAVTSNAVAMGRAMQPWLHEGSLGLHG